MNFDYLIVGAGLYGAVFAQQATMRGKKCLVVEKRGHIGGNCYTEDLDGITVHRYGPHIFHTSNKAVWEYVNNFAEFSPFINSPLAYFRGKIYPLPFNMHTFYALWGITDPRKAREKISSQLVPCLSPKNLREQALSLAGTDIYKTLIEGYTEKQWGKSAEALPPEIIKRIPLRFTYNNNYFDDIYQGIPKGGYTCLIQNLLKGSRVELDTDYLENRMFFEKSAQTTICTGAIDEFFGYTYGCLEYRSLRFETSRERTENYQGNAVINYTDKNVPYTRIIEHKHFGGGKNLPYTYITREYPEDWVAGKERFYPINNAANNVRYNKYRRLAAENPRVIFGGRLGLYKYLDMDDVVESALALAERII